MSKFIDTLNRFSKGEPQGMGFTARQSASPKPKMQVVASLAAESAESLVGHLGGADVGLISISKLAAGAEALQKLSQSLPDIILGGWLQGSNNADTNKLTKAGCDFIVFSASQTPVTLMKGDDKTSKIIEVEASLTDSLLRTVNDLPVDAVLITGDEKTKQLTWNHLMLFRRLSALLTKPLLAPVPSTVTAGELEALWEAGLSAVVIEIDSKQPADRLTKLRQEIDKIEFPSRRKSAGATVPRMSQPPNRKADDDDEDE